MKQSALCFFVAGDPAGQPRVKARFTGKFTQIYTPSTVKNSTGRHKHPAVIWKSQIAAAWLEFRPPAFEEFTGPVKLTMSFFMPRPKAHFNAKGMLKLSAPNFCPKKPDFDNLAKAVADRLTSKPKENFLGAWVDDDQVCISITVKRYADAPDAAGCEIQIERLNP